MGAWRRFGPVAKIGAVLGLLLAEAGCILGWRWVIHFVMNVEGIGTVVADRLLAFLLMLMGGMLAMSAMLAALNTLFLSPEVGLLRSLPAPVTRVYANRAVQTGVSAAWMVVVFGWGLLAGHWWGVGGNWSLFPLILLGHLFLICLIVNMASAFVTVLARVLPAQKARHIVLVLTTVLMIGFVALVRIMKPEGLANPENLNSAARYLAVLSGPGLYWLPSDWLLQGAMAALMDDPKTCIFYVAYLGVASALSYLFAGWVYEISLDKAYTKIQEVALSPLRKGKRSLIVDAITERFPVEANLALKEGREFFRDPGQVVQLLILGALVGLYLYNFHALQLQGGVMQMPKTRNMLALFNMALASFVLGAVAQRLFSMRHGADPKAMWVIRTMPLPASRVYRYELWSAFLPLTVMAGALLFISARILNASESLLMMAAFNAILFSWIIAHLTVYTCWRWPPQGSGNQMTWGGVVLVFSSLFATVAVLLLERLPFWINLSFFLNPQGFAVWLLGLFVVGTLLLKVLSRMTIRLYLPT